MNGKIEINIDDVLALYKERVAMLEHELIMITARANQLERELEKERENK